MTSNLRTTAPFNNLFAIGRDDEWNWHEGEPNYAEKFGFTSDHVPELIALTKSWVERELVDDDSYFAPIYAWRILGQLQIFDAVEPLLSIMDSLDEQDDDWFQIEFPRVFACIGPSAIPLLGDYLWDPSHREYSREAAAHGLAKIAQCHPETRDDAIKIISDQLAKHEVRDDLNGLRVCHLLELHASEAAEVIERAFAADVIDEGICGDWDVVGDQLGVTGLGLEMPRRPRNSMRELRPNMLLRSHVSDAAVHRTKDEQKKRKSKRKKTAQAKKRNRKL